MSKNLTLKIFGALLIASMMCACNSFEKGANAYSKKILELGEEYLSVPFGGDEKSIATPVESTKTYLESMSETAKVLKENSDDLESGIKNTKEGYSEAKTAVKEGVVSAKKSVRSFARSLPRSRKEANQLAYREGEGAMKWLKDKTAELAEKNQLKKKSQKNR